MTKMEFIDLLSQNSTFNQHQSKTIFENIFSLMLDVLTKECEKNGIGELKIPGFGVFTLTKLPERCVRNPKTGERVKSPTTKILKFRMSSSLKNQFVEK